MQTKDLKNGGKKMNEFKRFLEEIVTDAQSDEGDFGFVLLRWSKEEPYWCVFACSHGTKYVGSSIEGVTGIGGHFCISKEENFHNVLTVIVDSGWKVEVHNYF